MKIGRLTSTVLLTVILWVPALAQEPRAVGNPEDLGFSSDRLNRVTKAFQGYVDDNALPGAVVLIARNDKVAYFKAFGYRDRERKLAMTTDSVFRLASMTKPIVSVTAMTLAEEGKLDLAAPVSKYLPEFKDLQVASEQKDPATGKIELIMRPQKRPMIVQDLLRHTAGLVYAPPTGDGAVSLLYRDANVSNRDETLAEMVTKLSKLPLAHQPGEVWDYSVATDVLGRVIEVVSGAELDRVVEERVTKPLGLTSTGFYLPATDADRIAQPQPDPSDPPLFDPTKKPKRFSGGGGAVSTAGDYWRFCEMLLNAGKFGNARLLAPSTVGLMTANALRPGIEYGPTGLRFSDSNLTPALGQSFGLGFAIRTDTGQNPLPGSVGSFYWSGAYGTTFYIDPEEKLIIIMMIQAPRGTGAQYRHAVRYLAYQALTSSE